MSQNLNKIDTIEDREKIIIFQRILESIPGSVKGNSDLCPLKHSFADGIYVREIFIPKGTFVVGKIHKHAHPNFLLKGKVSVYTEQNKLEVLEAPLSMISAPGTKRVVYAHEDSVWVTVHANPEEDRDVETLENKAVVLTYQEYDHFLLESNKENQPCLLQP